MLEEIAWITFEATGSIEAYMIYRELEEEPEIKDKSNDFNESENLLEG